MKPKIGLIIIAVADVRADNNPRTAGVAPRLIAYGEIMGAITVTAKKYVNVASKTDHIAFG